MILRYLLTISLVFMMLLAPAAASAKQKSACGPEPRLSRSLHQAIFKAQKLFDKKEFTQALAGLEKYCKSHPDTRHFRLSFFKGVLNYQLNRLTQAQNDFRAASELRPCFLPALRNLATVQFELKQPVAAARTALKAYALTKPPDHELAYMAAVFFLSAQQPRKALPWLEKITLVKAPPKKWLKALARTYLELKQRDKARPVLVRLIKMDPEDAALWRLLAGLEISGNKYKAAAAALEVAVRLKGHQSGDWRNLGSLYQAAGAPRKAAEYYRRHFGPTPTAKQWYTLAQIYLQANLLAQATEAAQKAVSLGPDARRLAFLAEIYLREKKYNKALETFEAAAGKARSLKAGRYYLMSGYCALHLDRWHKAAKAFSQALQHGAKDPSLAKEAKQALKQAREHLAYLKEVKNSEAAGRTAISF
jgi:tetratricopeptide (TPR) repeat protein